VEFDRKILGWMRNGQGRELANLTNEDLIQNGEIELRQWITLMGMIDDRKPELLVYEPFYRGLLGMAVGYWSVAEAYLVFKLQILLTYEEAMKHGGSYFTVAQSDGRKNPYSLHRMR
jgi:hypothetical protein